MTPTIELSLEEIEGLREVPTADLRAGDRCILLDVGTAYLYGGPGGRLNFNPGGWSNPTVTGRTFEILGIEDGIYTVKREADGATQVGPIHPDRLHIRFARAEEVQQRNKQAADLAA